MRFLCLCAVTVLALWSAWQTRAPLLLKGYLLAQLLGTLLCELTLWRFSLYSDEYRIAYYISSVLTTATVVGLGWQFTRAHISWVGKWIWMLAWAVSLFIGSLSYVEAIRHEDFAYWIALQAGTIYMATGILALTALPVLAGQRRAIAACLGFLWTFQSCWQFNFFMFVQRERAYWLALNEWVPAVVYCLGLGSLAISLLLPTQLPFRRPRKVDVPHP